MNRVQKVIEAIENPRERQILTIQAENDVDLMRLIKTWREIKRFQYKYIISKYPGKMRQADVLEMEVERKKKMNSMIIYNRPVHLNLC